jgi:hypothetical protein
VHFPLSIARLFTARGNRNNDQNMHRSINGDSNKQEAQAAAEEDDSSVCVICCDALEQLSEAALDACRHCFHIDCIKQWANVRMSAWMHEWVHGYIKNACIVMTA